MNERLRYKRALVLVLTVVLHSFLPCRSFEIFVDAPSAPEVDFAEEQREGADSSIEQIFQSPKYRRNAVSGSKHEPGAEPGKVSRRSPPGENLVRTKREGAGKKSDRKGLKEAAKAAEKRSVAGRIGKSSLRAGRGVRDAVKQAARLSADYETGLDDRADYGEELEDDSVDGSNYKSNDLKLAEDRFIDQDERSALYDDLEEKDVVKRGVAGSEDYEELNDRVDEPEDNLEERGSLEEAAKARSDARIKREHGSKKREVVASSGPALKEAKPEKESSVADDQAGKKDSQLAEDRPVDAGKETKLGEDRSKPEQAASDETDQSKRNVAVDAFKPVPDADGSKQAPLTNDQVQLATEEGKTQDSSPSCDKKAVDEPPDLSGASKLEEAKVAELLAPASAAVAAKSEPRAGSPENSINPDSPAAEQQSEQSEQSDRDYEKRVEEQIQRKIDSIKEEIKREIAESEKLEEIESNNAKFDELLDQQEDEQDVQDEQEQLAAEAAASEKRANPSKRSAATLDRSQKRVNGDKRLMKRRKRQDGASLENVVNSAGSNSKLEKKSTAGEGVKQFVASSLSAPGPNNAMAPRKRDAPREAYLVKRDRSKKKRRRRSREYEQGNSREALKARSASQQLTDDEAGALHELAAPSNGKPNSVASLMENAEELGPLASEYGEAFGGLQGVPGLALARFKRIKRVLRPRSSEA